MSTANAKIVLILGLIGSPLFAQSNTEWRIPGYSSYVELKDGTVFCGNKYDSYHESRTGDVCTAPARWPAGANTTATKKTARARSILVVYIASQ